MDIKKKQIKFDGFHWVLIILLVLSTVTNFLDEFEQTPTTEELIQQGRDLEIMKQYSPCELLDAVEQGEFDYNNLSDTIKELLSVADEC